MSRVDEAMRRARRGATGSACSRRRRTLVDVCRRRTRATPWRWRARRIPLEAPSGGPRPAPPAGEPATRRSAASYDSVCGRRGEPAGAREHALRAPRRPAHREDRRRPEHEPGVARAVPAARRGAARRPEHAGPAGRHGGERGGGRGQDADRREPRADLQRVVPEARAAHRRRPAAADAAHGVPARHRARASATACCRPAKPRCWCGRCRRAWRCCRPAGPARTRWPA